MRRILNIELLFIGGRSLSIMGCESATTNSVVEIQTTAECTIRAGARFGMRVNPSRVNVSMPESGLE
jgi:hypothetical protein